MDSIKSSVTRPYVASVNNDIEWSHSSSIKTIRNLILVLTIGNHKAHSNPNPKGEDEMPRTDLQYSIHPARYAKGKIAIQTPGVGGWKSLACLILTTEIAPSARYSGRESSYIVSPRQAARFVSAIKLANRGTK